ncbi:hypothetical protein UCRPC4_g06194 [Phaeomoniella chlamydospora]|uniref:Uncharacterized protein n=1 Tax=Phaeomoniella chlamydospora TaxID=158046 RepID=A0A0G2FUW8_PHACM|nr:hypothetical protein UCRPC4_g06194 [Phaeomoniella chlamydospora]
MTNVVSALGASLHNILTRLKAQPTLYPNLDIAYSSSEPVIEPVVLTLPTNGIRLRFDGPDQRLRLVEVLDFTKTSFSYKGTDLVRHFKTAGDVSKEQEAPQSGPSFRHVYNRLFGPSYPGEYIPPGPKDKSGLGTYVLSYPGIAFSFPVQDSKWSPDADFVALLSSSAALPAKSMAIFHGSSWSDARSELYTQQPQFPRAISLNGRSKEVVADEIEQVLIKGNGKLEVIRRNSPIFVIRLSETTPQDLVAELGPPDAIYRKYDDKIAIHGEQRGADLTTLNGRLQSTSHNSNTGLQQDFLDSPDPSEVGGERDTNQHTVPVECFYNYFHHGFDALVSQPADKSPAFPAGEEDKNHQPSMTTSQMVVTKILLHGNVPGSYPFNRHRRSRWVIDLATGEDDGLTSEMPFPEISAALVDTWRETYANREQERSLQRGMVLNRGWGESPDSSLELLGGWEESGGTTGRMGPDPLMDGVQGLGNTELFGFPGLLFEVLKNGTVSCLTVY